MQTPYKLDKESVFKVLKGGLIAATGAFGLYILNAIGEIEVSNPTLVSFIAFLIPTFVNLIKEWVRGEKVELE